jgi:DNA-binding NarL/FixJ family response regulator
MSLPSRILLVEDDPVDARLALELLREAIAGCRAVHVDSLDAAARILGAEEFDAVLLDLRLPDGAGVEALHRIRDACGAAVIVVLTSVDDDELAAEMVSAGAEDYLVKGRLAPESLARVLRFAARRRGRVEQDESGPSASLPVVALVGRHTLLLDGLAAALRISGTYGVLGPIATAPELTVPDDGRVQVVVVHLGHGGDADASGTEGLRMRFGSARIVLLAGDTDRWLSAVLDRGDADALLPDTSSAAQIVAAIGRVLADEVVLPPGWRARRARDTAADPLAVLSERQREVLVHVAAGYSNEQIAEQLFISVNTVKYHVRSAYTALGIHSRLQAARIVAAAGGR